MYGLKNQGTDSNSYVRRILAALLLLCCTLAAYAAVERYDYDSLGRVSRYIAPDGKATEYVYDAAGNILQVITGDTVQAPSISGITPASIRRGETKQVVITGTGLNGANIAIQDPNLVVTDFQAGPTQVSFSLYASLTAALGTQVISLSNGAGNTTVNLAVNPVLPVAAIAPLPIAIPPDGVARQTTLRLSNADTIDHTFAISSKDATVVSVSPANLTIAAGQTSALLTVVGKKLGQTSITLVSPTLGTILAPVYVTTEYVGINTSAALSVGVVKETTSTPTSRTISPVLAPAVGIAVGGFIKNIAPNKLTIGTGPTTLTINGEGLQSVASVAIVPADGLTLGAIAASPDGKTVTIPVTVASNAPLTMRKVVVTAPTGKFTPASPDADRLSITLPAPEVTSVEPLFGTVGTSALGLVVRGRNLQNAGSVLISPADGITAGSSPSISADGTQLSTSLSISPIAPLGAKLVQVTTPGGTSSNAASPYNTFTLVNQIQSSVTPIQAATVGVVKQTTPQPTSSSYGIYAPVLGIAVGSVISNVDPATGVIADSLTLTFSGNELQNVTAVQFTPNTGLTVGVPVPAADGKSFTVSLVIASDAPRTLRAIKVLAGSASIPFSQAPTGRFLVTLPMPRIDSVDPIVVPIPSTSLTLTINGANFVNATSVQVTPSAGVSIANPPTVSSDGNHATVSISVAASAATGQRMVSLVTPAGGSASVATVANTINLTSAPGPTYGITANVVGVNKQIAPSPKTASIDPIAAPIVGIVKQSAPAVPGPTAIYQVAPAVGVTKGQMATGIAPAGIMVGTTSSVVVSGAGLDAVTGVSLNPSTGITLGASQANADGTQLTIPVTIAAGATIGLRQLKLTTGTGQIVFTNPNADRLWIAAGTPHLDSISPILANQGTSFTLTIRGSNLQGATDVIAEPVDGLIIGGPITVNSDGTIITVGAYVKPDATIESHVIRVVVPGLMSSPDAVPANTFTVYPP